MVSSDESIVSVGENGILTGTTATTLAPKGTATRAQIAAILARYLAG